MQDLTLQNLTMTDLSTCICSAVDTSTNAVRKEGPKFSVQCVITSKQPGDDDTIQHQRMQISPPFATVAFCNVNNNNNDDDDDDDDYIRLPKKTAYNY